MTPDRLPADYVTRSVLDYFSSNVRVRLVATQKIQRRAPWFFCAGPGAASFYAVLRGRCRIGSNEWSEYFRLRTGDLAVLPHGNRHWLQSDRGSDDQTVIFRGRFRWNCNEILPLLKELPPAIRLDGENGEFASWMKEYSGIFADDSAIVQPCFRALINQMVHEIFAQSVLGLPGHQPACIREHPRP